MGGWKMKRKPGVKPIEVDRDVLKAAYLHLRSIRLVAHEFGVSRMTIQRRVRQAEQGDQGDRSDNVGQRRTIKHRRQDADV